MTQMEQLEFCIQALEREMPEYLSYGVPQEPEEAFRLFRALCNVRMPAPAEESFLRVQDEMLQEMTREKGIVEAESLPCTPRNPQISLWQGDITTLRSDAIVNAANSQMLGCFQPLHGCIDNIIHTMAGVQLRNKCYTIMQKQGHEEPTGQVKCTPGYNLPAKFVLHTVGPIVMGDLTEQNEEDLRSCYRSCLDEATRQGCKSIAFCCISTGVFRFPADRAAEIAVETAEEWLHQNEMHVIFNVFKDRDRAIYENLLGK